MKLNGWSAANLNFLDICQHSLHQQTLLLVGSHVAPPSFETVFLHLYAMLIV